MSLDSQPRKTAGLQRELGTFDLVLLYVAAIIGPRWLSTAAQYGPASVTLWIIALLVFFVPSALTVQELSSRIPHEGGLHLWTKAAFGEVHGFLAGWAYWLSNLTFFPSLLLFVSGIVLHIGPPSWRPLAESPLYNGLFCLSLLWAVTLVNVLGLKNAKWVQNVGGLGQFAVTAQVLLGGALAWWQFGSATPMSAASLVPDWSTPATLSMFAILILAFVGFELGPLLGDEIKNSAQSIRRAIYFSSFIIALTYVAGTLALLVALPPTQIGAIGGVPEAMEAIGQRSGIAHFGMISATLLAITGVGGLGAWLTGTGRLPFVLGLGHYLPKHVLSVDEVEQVMQQPDIADPMGVRDRAILETLYSTGMRRGEFVQLKLYDVDLRNGTVFVRQGKGKKDRFVPIGERAIKWIEKYLCEVRPELVIEPDDMTLFLSQYGEAFSRDHLSGLVHDYIEAANLGKGGGPHLLRHTMATLMLENGADLRFIQEMLGHEKITTTQIYAHVSIRQLKLVHEHTHPAELKPENTAAKEAAKEGDAQARAELLSALDAEEDDE